MRLVAGLLAVILLSSTASAALPKGLDAATPSHGGVIAGYSPDSVRRVLATMPLHAIEGIWQWADIDTRVAIVRPGSTPASLPATLYTMTVVHASDPSLRPGTVMGYIATTAKRDQYDARIYTAVSAADGTPYHPAKYILELNDAESRISFRPYGSKMRFNWWRLLPYRFRGLFTRDTRTDGDVSGLLRIYPQPQRPHHPVYL